MDRKWGNQTRKSGRKGERADAAAQTEQEQTFREADEGIWDFKRTSAAQDEARFAFNRRIEEVSSYRVVGQTPARGSFSRPATGPSYGYTNANQARPNRFNAGVKMVAGDLGPAPWEDWQSVSYLKMPVMGEVAAGRYDVTVAYHEPGEGADADFVLVNSAEVKISRSTFALRVRGSSMIDNEIENGDIIIVQAQDWADDGDFVIACLTDSSDTAGFVTLKRFYRHRQADRIVLQPANQSLSPIHILPRKGDANSEDLDGVKIQGRVTAVIKTGGL